VIGPVRRLLRRRIPEPVRLRIALSRRRLRDAVSGRSRLIVRTAAPFDDLTGWIEVASIAQPIRQSAHWEGKLANLRLAAGRLNRAVIAPGRIFSFWALTGAPVAANGFQVGRSIRDDVLGADVGGGLCQLSGLVYELGLRSGMDVVERHPHTQDLYTEATRFTPLGLDATIVWGHKDLRLRNGLRYPIAFEFVVEADRVAGTASSSSVVSPATLNISRTDDADRRLVEVFRTPRIGSRELVSSDVYAVSPAGGLSR
jgi:vancomycin resistance protein VanW